MAERTIKHKIFTYFVETEGVKGDGSVGTVTLERQARRGEKVDIPREADVNRGDAAGAFYTEEELKAIAAGSPTPGVDPTPTPADATGAAPNIADRDVGSLQSWLEGGDGPGSKPSVPQVLNAVNAVPEDQRKEVAQRVLEAEQARDGEPRSTLVDPLEEFLAEEG